MVDVPGIDDEHRLLAESCCDLERALTGGAPAARFESIYQELVQRSAKHFSHEEREMRAGGYALYAWHRRQHVAARAKITALGGCLRCGDTDEARDLLQSLGQWLNDHIRLADRMLGAYLRNRERARAAAVAV